MSARWVGHGRGLKRSYTLGDTGWEVIHCGHGQAHRPWWVRSPEGLGYVSPTGGAWSSLAGAQAAAEVLAAGGSGAAWPMPVCDELVARQKAGEDVSDERWVWVRRTHAAALRALEVAHG